MMSGFEQRDRKATRSLLLSQTPRLPQCPEPPRVPAFLVTGCRSATVLKHRKHGEPQQKKNMELNYERHNPKRSKAQTEERPDDKDSSDLRVDARRKIERDGDQRSANG
jgi:hypothetical protein